jgi:hypothetical protein
MYRNGTVFVVSIVTPHLPSEVSEVSEVRREEQLNAFADPLGKR